MKEPETELQQLEPSECVVIGGMGEFQLGSELIIGAGNRAVAKSVSDIPLTSERQDFS